MLIFGKLNAFRPSDARQIITQASNGLLPGGRVLLEIHTFNAVRDIGQSRASWRSWEAGLFSDSPHLLLQEDFWDKQAQAAIRRYFVIDAPTAEIARHSQTLQAYTNEAYGQLLLDCGLDDVEFQPALTGDSEGRQPGLQVIVADRCDLKVCRPCQDNTPSPDGAATCDCWDFCASPAGPI